MAPAALVWSLGHPTPDGKDDLSSHTPHRLFDLVLADASRGFPPLSAFKQSAQVGFWSLSLFTWERHTRVPSGGKAFNMLQAALRDVTCA